MISVCGEGIVIAVEETQLLAKCKRSETAIQAHGRWGIRKGRQWQALCKAVASQCKQMASRGDAMVKENRRDFRSVCGTRV